MPRRRTGYVRFRDGRWHAVVAREYLGSFATQKEAKRCVALALAEDAGKTPESFLAYGEKWLDERELAARARKRGRAFAKERSTWNAHVAGADWVVWPLKRITPRVLQAWVTETSKKNAQQATWTREGTVLTDTGRRVSRRIPEKALQLVKLCLDHAVIEGKIAAPNPARLVKLPREEVSEDEGELVVHASAAEVVRLFGLELPPLQRSVFATAIYVGLRLDELWGLRWEHLTLDGRKPVARVRRSYDGPVKSKHSRRDVPLLPPAVEALRAWRDSLTPRPIAGLVWPRDDGGCRGASYTAGWRDKPMRDEDGELIVRVGWGSKAGIGREVTFHALRHTCGCHLAQGTWTPRPLSLHEIKRWLGHSSIAVTERHYAALTVDNLHAAVSGGNDERKATESE